MKLCMKNNEGEKVYQVIIASYVNDRMYEHFKFLARVSVNAANKFLDRFLEDIRNLRRTPFRYPLYNRIYLTPRKRYRTIYHIIGNQVFSDDIQDADKNLVTY